MEKITLSEGVYKYKSIPLYLGKKKMHTEISKAILFDFQKIMLLRNIPFSLAYGTLLGAIREKDFIKYDEDIDINILEEDRNNFLNCLFELRKSGFEVARYDKRGFISLIKNNEYIDICFFHKETENLYECCGNFLFKEWVMELESYSFLNGSFLIPKDYNGFLNFYYGENWNIPVEYTYSPFQKFTGRLILFFKQLLPPFIKYYLLNQKSKRQKQIFIDKFKLPDK